MAYEMVMPYHLHMPSYFLETFTEYPYLGAEYNSCVRNEYRFVLYYMASDFFYRHPEFMEKLE